MASIKISELEEVTELSNSDVLPIINDNETKKISINKLDERYASAEDFENIKTIENGEIFLIELPKLPYGGTGGSWLMKRELTERQQQMIIDTFNYCLQNNIKYPILKVTSTAETVTASGSNFFYLNTPIPTPKHNVGTTLNFTSIGTKQTDNGAMAVCELSITLLYDEDNGYWLNPSGTVLYIVNSSDKIVTTNYAKENYLNKTNTTAYTPTADYHPATKKYVDDTVAAGGGSGGGTNTPKSAIYQLNTTKYLSIPSTYTNEDMLATISEAFTKYFNGETGIPTFRLTAADSMCLNPDYYFILYQLNGLNATYYAHKLYNSYSIKGYSPTLYIVKMDFTLTNTDGVYTTTGVNVSYMTQGEMLLLSTNTKQYTPTSDYNPATKKYVDDAISTAITTVLGGEY